MKKFLNLIPFAQKEQLKRERMFLLVYGITGILVIVIAFNAIMLTITRFILIDHFKKLRDDSSLVNTELLKLQGNIGKTNEKIENAEKMQTKFVKYSDLLPDFTKLIPEGIVVNFMHIDSENSNFRINGVAQDRNTLVAFKDSLESASFILNLESPLSNFLEKKDIVFRFSGKLMKGIYHD
ncbi:hypothetical protein KKF64_00460 [Patescibacteria group bacterium]|nr:hypothetical protein [Patescibacteria group bacterium]